MQLATVFQDMTHVAPLDAARDLDGEMMKLSAKSLTRKTDLRDFVGKMTLIPMSQDESVMLAYLHNAMVSGGKITISLSAKANKMTKHKGSFEITYQAKK